MEKKQQLKDSVKKRFVGVMWTNIETCCRPPGTAQSSYSAMLKQRIICLLLISQNERGRAWKLRYIYIFSSNNFYPELLKAPDNIDLLCLTQLFKVASTKLYNCCSTSSFLIIKLTKVLCLHAAGEKGSWKIYFTLTTLCSWTNFCTVEMWLNIWKV